MPITNCNKDGKPGYHWGKNNKSCFTYTPGDEASRKAAKKKAIKQGIAIEGPEGFKSKAHEIDIHPDELNEMLCAVAEQLKVSSENKYDSLADYLVIERIFERSAAKYV
jgi:hypothetical protein